MKNRIASGFTLLELLVTIVLIAIIFQMVMTLVPLVEANQARAYLEGAFEKNRSVALGLLKHANESDGRLPAPFIGTSGAIQYASVAASPTAVDAATIAIKNNIATLGVPPEQVFHDGTFAQNVRVYQRVSGLTKDLPIRGVAGDTVTVVFDTGVVYQTECSQLQACNIAVPGVSLPGASPIMTSANYATWQPIAPDKQAYFISTLDYQKRLLDLTMDNIAIMIRRVQSDYAYRSITSAPNDTTNFYYAPNNSGAPVLNAFTDSLINEGCYDGWYALNASNVNILDRYGLTKKTYGTTSWGGSIEFCRDYDAINAGKNALPHSAAIRFNRNATSGSAPVVGQNIIIAF
jgi:prepilin-type N-terminal cleavage/methylation domain-containing protein